MVFSGCEQLLLLYSDRRDLDPDGPSLVFIVGAPRSGTSIAFQYITQRLNVSFPTHFCALFPQAPALSLVLSDALFRRPHRCLRSIHGFSIGDGLRGPNEWETLFRDRVCKRLRQGRNLAPEFDRLLWGIDLWIDRPVIVKALNVSLSIGSFAQIVPRSKFLWVDRDPLSVARSIYRAKRREGKMASQIWYVSNDALESMTFGSEAEQIASQVTLIRDSIASSFEMLPDNRRERLSYHDLCTHPERQIEKVAKWLGSHITLRSGEQLSRLDEAISKPLDDQKVDEDLHRLLGTTSLT